MAPYTTKVIGAILRVLLGGLFAILSQHGLVNADDWTGFISELVGYLGLAATLGWAWFKNHRDIQQALTAQSLGVPVTANEVKQIVARGQAPSVLTPADTVPTLTAPSPETH